MSDRENVPMPDDPVDILLRERRSRFAAGGQALSGERLMRLFEAVRCASVSYGAQPWRLIWTRHGTADFEAVLALLAPCDPPGLRRASALALVASSTSKRAASEPKPVLSRSHSFDPCSSWMALALRSRACGWYGQDVVGIDWARAARDLNIPDDFRIEGAVAIGRTASEDGRLGPQGTYADLPPRAALMGTPASSVVH